MIRPFTCICALLACGAGLYLYQSKHQAQLLDREIARTVHQAEAARERSGVLRAEYTRLNDPQRLAELANDHLTGLKSTAPAQFTTWAELEKRLPPVGAPVVEAPPLEPEAPAAKLPEAKPDAGKPDAGKPDVGKPDAARPPEAAKPPEPKPDSAKPIAARPAPSPAILAQRPVPAAMLASAAPPRPAATPRPVGAPVSLTASLQAPASQPVAAPPPRPALLAAVSTHPAPPRGGAVYPPAPAQNAPAMSPPAMGSSLGMARSMAAPAQPVRASAPAIWRPGNDYQQAGTQ